MLYSNQVENMNQRIFHQEKSLFTLKQILFHSFLITCLVGLYLFILKNYFDNSNKQLLNYLTSLLPETAKKENQKSKKSEGYTIEDFMPELNKIKEFEVNFAKDITERLDNVKGITEVKKEIEDLINLVKNRDQITEAGGKIFKGVLLHGKPGTGKTLISRAIAGEASVNFIYLTGSDFDGMFVGVGSRRVRKLFETARENSPCIIFIDEADTLLTKSRRGAGENSSSRSTLNQFLTEMDGFRDNEGITVLAATNHSEALDPAAVRPGRFDKSIHINVPSEEGRQEIVDYFLQKVALKLEDISSAYIAKLTPGFTGAELENLINIAVVNNVYKRKNSVDMNDIFDARDRVMMGLPKKHYKVAEKRRFRTAIHEIGHTFACYKSEVCRPHLHKVTIIPMGMAEGVTMFLSDDNELYTKKKFMSDIEVALGGRAAEALFFGDDDTSAGCSNDLSKATQTAQEMIKKFGMFGNEAGYSVVQDEGYKWEDDVVSGKQKRVIDELANRLLMEADMNVEVLFKQNADEIKRLARMLYRYNTLTIDEIELVLQNRENEIKREVVREDYI